MRVPAKWCGEGRCGHGGFREKKSGFPEAEKGGNRVLAGEMGRVLPWKERGLQKMRASGVRVPHQEESWKPVRAAKNGIETIDPS